MRTLRAWLLRLGGLFGKARRERELAEEMESHLRMHVEDNLRAGMSAEEARRVALMRLGGIEQTKEIYRDRRGLPALETLWQDLRFAARMMRKNPGFTAIAALTLALGIGANTAIFSIVNAVVLRPLPYKDSSQLIDFELKSAAFPNFSLYLSWPAFQAVRANADTLEQTSACWQADRTLTGGNQPAILNVTQVSDGFFEELGARAAQGRLLTDQDQKPDQNHVAVISNAFWHDRFGADPAIVGRQMTLDKEVYTIVGVAAKGFAFPERNDVWLPFALTADMERNPALFGFEVLGRLRKGATRQRLQAQLDILAARLSQELQKEKPDLKAGYKINARSLLDSRVQYERESYLVLLAAATLVLLIACANLTSMLLARGWGRNREMAVRVALGASSGRLQRQVLVESCLLALLGGAAGIALAAGGVRLFQLIAPEGTARLSEVTADWTLLWFALASSLIAGLVFGLAPARRASRMAPNELIKQGTGSAASTSRLGSAMVVLEVALAFVLLIGSTLMLQTLTHLLRQDPGFRTDHLLTLDLPQKNKWFERGSDAQLATQVAHLQEILRQVRQLPGVESAVASDHGMLNGIVYSNAGVKVEGALPENGSAGEGLSARYLSPGYFRTLGTALVRGREFDERDAQSAQRVAVVNEAMAKKFWGTLDVIGRRISISKDPQGVPEWTEIVGVVTDIRDTNIQTEASPEYYLALFQWNVSSHHLVVRTRMNPDSLADTISRQIWEVNPEQPITHVMTLSGVVAESVGDQRVETVLLGIFAAVGLALALLGIYGVVSYSVARRTQEIGVRMALGAERADVLRMVLRQGLKLVGLGAAIGAAGALAGVRAIASDLYGVTPSDPWTFGGGIAAILVVACWVPAQRAMRVDPMIALRYE
jgi:predicted permease